MSGTYQKWLFELPSALEEIFGATLWGLGCEGLEDPDTTPQDESDRPQTSPEENERIRLIAYFSDPAPPAAETFVLGTWAEQGVRLLDREILPSRDWLAEYRAFATPIDVGVFRLDPREPEDDEAVARGEIETEAGNRHLLRLPARTAFGTGSHESTRLALRLLERLAEEGRLMGATLLDVGTGSGVLSFAALRLGARQVVAYDIDLPSVCMAETNRRLNPWPPAPGPLFFAGRPTALSARARFDLLLVNILPERIAGDLPTLARQLGPGGRLLSSGNLVTQRNLLLDRFAELGLGLELELEDGEWLAMVMRAE